MSRDVRDRQICSVGPSSNPAWGFDFWLNSHLTHCDSQLSATTAWRDLHMTKSAGAEPLPRRGVSAGIKQRHFRRFCSSEAALVAGTRYALYMSFQIACEAFGKGRPWHARTGSWENGFAAIASVRFSHPSSSLLRPPAAIQPASDGAVTITTGGRSPPIRCIGRGVWRARSNGARSTLTTGGSCWSKIPRGRNETGSASGKGTSAGDKAVLPTITQLQILPTTAQPSRKSLNQKRWIFLANNSLLVKGSPSAP